MASHPFRRNKRKGWGTEVLEFVWLGGKLGQQLRINGTPVKLRQSEIAVEANAGEQSLAGCGIELLRQRFFSALFLVRRIYSMINCRRPAANGMVSLST